MATLIITVFIAIMVVTIIVRGVKNKKEGKHSCSCGGSCGVCPMNCENHK